MRGPVRRGADAANTGHANLTGPAESVVERWNYSTGDDRTLSPAVVNGTVYVGDNDGTVYALTETTAPACDPGDANGDGSITSGDATLVLRDVVGLPTPGLTECADVNGGGSLTSGDATVILREVVGLPG